MDISLSTLVEELIVLYEDNHVIVVYKPQNIPSCEDVTKDIDMLSIVKEYIRIKEKKPGNVYVGLVHRLDRVTGGVMVFAKSSKAASRLSEQMRNGDFEKKYFTVLIGNPPRKKAVLTDYLEKNPINNMVYVCPQATSGAKLAELDYEILEEQNGLSFAVVTLHTGRTHQIRVQMSNMGYPVYGDMRYGGEKAAKGNIALWATTLSFSHPVSKERLVFKIEPPVDKTPWKLFDVSSAMKR